MLSRHERLLYSRGQNGGAARHGIAKSSPGSAARLGRAIDQDTPVLAKKQTLFNYFALRAIPITHLPDPAAGPRAGLGRHYRSLVRSLVKALPEPHRHHYTESDNAGTKEFMMGAWGIGIYENDAADDFIGDLAEDPTSEMLLDALRSPFEEDDVDYWSEALAAAGAIAYFAGHPAPGTLEALSDWADDANPPSEVPATEHLIRQALKTSEYCLSEDNDLRSLIADAGEIAPWQQELKALIMVLRHALADCS